MEEKVVFLYRPVNEDCLMIVDLHSHLLPNIDDGSKSYRASIRMAKEAVDNGIRAALMTPHHMNGHYVNHKPDVIRLTEEFQSHLDNNNISFLFRSCGKRNEFSLTRSQDKW